MAEPRRSNGGSGMGGFYRLCRMLHAYLSAFAFLALMFFSVTGLTLNHPDWVRKDPVERVLNVTLPKADLDVALKAKDPPRALAEAVGRRAKLIGGYQSGEILDGEALLRLEGPSGATDITLSLATGKADIGTRRAGFGAMLNDLHKGKTAGPVWSLVIDIAAVLFLLLSVIGYVLFFSLRFRLKPSLILTAVSLVALVGVVALFVA